MTKGSRKEEEEERSNFYYGSVRAQRFIAFANVSAEFNFRLYRNVAQSAKLKYEAIK